MKYLLISLMLMLSACTSSTEFGPCVGLNGGENPKLEYKYSAKNIAIGFFFSSLILPPIFVALDEYKCPVGNK